MSLGDFVVVILADSFCSKYNGDGWNRTRDLLNIRIVRDLDRRHSGLMTQ
jgi:hypothetical protein